MPDLPAWLGLLNSIVGGLVLGLVLWLWLTGILVRGADVEVRLQERTDAHTATVEALKVAHDAAQKSLEDSHKSRVQALTARLDAVVADRDAWRTAHGEEVTARRTAEANTAQMLESSNIALGLLGALKDALARGPDG